jgi:DNA-directed RNA polymerase specialized sigma24 family protein
VSTQPLWSDIDGTESAVDGLTSCEDLQTALLRRQMIERALASLSDEARLLMALREVQGLACHEIAKIVCLPMGTVESRIFRAAVFGPCWRR